MADTIVGMATATGAGGIAIVRVSGENAETLFNTIFHPLTKKPPFESHRLMFGHVMDGETLIDQAMGVLMRAPNSYTREDVCEIHTHGGSVAATLTVKLLLKLGAQSAQAGEFTKRAFMNGRIDLAQAEAVMGVIHAQSTAALKAEQRQLAGGQSKFITDVQMQVLALLSGMEAHIDYPDEIDEIEAMQGLKEGIASIHETLDKAIDERSARIVREGLHIALCGAPNAGKSTLFNALLGEDRAIVTNIPGTTRDVLQGSFSLDGVRVVLMDTAGLRDSDDEVEQIGIERAKQTISQCDVALILIDGTVDVTPESVALLSMPMHCPCAVIQTKQDESDLIADLSTLTKHPIFPFPLSQVRGWMPCLTSFAPLPPSPKPPCSPMKGIWLWQGKCSSTFRMCKRCSKVMRHSNLPPWIFTKPCICSVVSRANRWMKNCLTRFFLGFVWENKKSGGMFA